MQAIIDLYRNAYKGLGKKAWFLASIILVNRIGTIVVAFMAVYLTQDKGFSMAEAGSILSFFGAGSIIGAYVGGQLTDRANPFVVQFWSLIAGGLLFWVLMFMESYWSIAATVFIQSIIGEAFRPANAAAVAYCSDNADNLTRAYALNRLATNLGYSIGPALGGIMAALDFRWLFVFDGFTSIAAALLLRILLWDMQKKAAAAKKNSPQISQKSPFRDIRFMFFILFTLLNVIIFFQIFSSLPLFYKKVYALSETRIGLLISLNGLFIVAFEMAFVYYLRNFKQTLSLVSIGSLFIGGAFLLLALPNGGVILLIISMLVLSMGEILTMPFSQVYTVSRADEGSRGAYLSMYVMAYSAAHIFAPLVGTYLAENFGFQVLWEVLGAASFISMLGFRTLAER
ncbi:MFS transporter [Rhodoflexus caldus]|uniref:MFS transporter n=1 Tax=Rhodoflexus caldus TaxID=2891236 RepID=UPI00202A615B|nr:MFS transporter [Rhodoflexus caldus]